MPDMQQRRSREAEYFGARNCRRARARKLCYSPRILSRSLALLPHHFSRGRARQLWKLWKQIVTALAEAAQTLGEGEKK